MDHAVRHAEILVVDDNEAVRYAVAHYLRQAGHRVTEAGTARDCLAAVANGACDLILLDVKLPDRNGVDVCRELKNDPKTAAIQIIQTSAFFTSTGDRITGLESGADAYLVAPFEPRELLAQVNALLRLREAEQARISSEQFSDSLLDSSFDCIKTLDVEGRMLSLNSGGLRLLEISDFEPYRNTAFVDFWLEADRPRIRQALSAARQGGTGHFHAFRPSDAGTPKWWEAIISPVRDPGGRVHRLLCISRDVTKRTQTEQRLRLALEAAQLGVWRHELDSDVIHLDERARAHYGIDRETVPAGEVLSRVHKDDTVAHREAVSRAIDPSIRGPVDIEYRVIHPDGSIRWLSVHGQVHFDSSTGEPRPLLGLGTTQDITTRKQIERALAESEQNFRALADNIAAFAWMADANGSVFWYNKRWFDYTGTTIDEMKGWGWQKVHHPEHVERVTQKIRHCFESGSPWEDTFPLRGKHGQYRWFLSRARPIRDLHGKVVRWFGTNTDITEQRSVQEALRESRARLEAALASMTDAVFITDNEGKIATFNDAFAVFHRFKNKEDCSKLLSDYPALFELLTRDGQVAALEQWPVFRALKGETTTDAEYILHRKDSGETWFGSYSYGPIRNRDGTIAGAVVAARDITEHRCAEQALRESEERLRLAKAAGQIGIHDFNPVTGELHWDEYLRKLWGLGPDDPINYETFLSGLHPMDRAHVDAAVQRALDPQGDGNLYVEYRLNRGDHPRWIAATGHARFENGRAVRFIGTVQDITQRKEFQAELERLVAERTAKLHELVGELEHFSYSITHDMRAPLRAMRGFAEVLKEMLPESEPPEMRTFLRHIITSAERMDHLITDALNYSRTVRQDLSLAPIDTHELLEGMLDTYPQFLANRDHLRIEGRLPVVLANESGMTQCFSNLVGNALKFVEPGKDPEILIRSEPVDKPGANPDENWVRIWIEDKGIGISPSMLPRLFSMFVRGSNRYEGTGIGLALVRKVVQRMGGSVGVESEPGQGSRFWLELRAPARETHPPGTGG